MGVIDVRNSPRVDQSLVDEATKFVGAALRGDKVLRQHYVKPVRAIQNKILESFNLLGDWPEELPEAKITLLCARILRRSLDDTPMEKHEAKHFLGAIAKIVNDWQMAEKNQLGGALWQK